MAKLVQDHCLYNWVGVEHCSLTESISGDYINDLPGMYTEMVQKIATGEEITFKNVFDKVQKRSFKRLEEYVVAQLSKEVKFNEIICQTYKLQPVYNKLVNIPASNEYRGIYIQLPQSKYSQLTLQTLQVFNAGTVDVITNLKAFDLNDGFELFTKEITLEPGLNSIPLDEEMELRYKIFQAFIGVDCSELETVKTESLYYGWYDNDGFCDYDCDQYYSGREANFELTAATLEIGVDPIYENMNRQGLGGGVTFQANVMCSVNQFICENKKSFTNSLQYLEAAEMLKQKLASPRVNFWTISNPEATALLKDEFEGMYRSALKRAIEGIPIRGEGECFNCEPVSQITYGGNMP